MHVVDTCGWVEWLTDGAHFEGLPEVLYWQKKA